MLKVAIISLFLLTGAASAIPFAQAWNFRNERVFGKVKKAVTVVGSELQKHVEYYNEKGQKTKIEDYFGKGDKLRRKYTMEYNKNGDLFKVSYFEGEAKSPAIIVKAEYKSKGVIKYLIYKGMDGKEEVSVKTEPFEYDEKKRLKSIKMKAEGEFNYKFDDKGNCTEYINDVGDIRFETKYGKYYNGVAQIMESYSRGKMSTSTVWKNKFDKAGNWIERIGEKTDYYWDSKDKDKKPETTKRTVKLKRTITYYPEKKKLD